MSSSAEAHDYRPAQRKKGRRMMMSFEIVNTISFSLLAGNIITLLMLRLGASSTLIGVLSAFPYIAFLFMPLAKGLVPKLGLVRTFGLAWTLRYGLIVPIVLAPLFVMWGMPQTGAVLVMLTYLLFQVLRGFGLVSLSPLNNELSAGKDRGEYLSRRSMAVSAASIVAGVAVAVLLGSETPIERYSVFMSVGIVLGFIGCALIYRIPEPPGARMGAATPFWADVKEGLSDRGFRRFMIAYAAIIFVSGLGRPFLIVYAKQIFDFGDDAAMVLTVVGSIGAIGMAWLSRMAMDRLGAKPLMSFWNAAFLISVIPVVFMPPLLGVGAWVFLVSIFLVNNLGGAGGENASQAYFFAIVKPHLQFNLGMLYFLIMGIAGALGSFIGGAALDGIAAVAAAAGSGTPEQISFHVFYAIVAVLGIGVFFLIARTPRLGARAMGDALQSIFSPRDLRTMNLLRRLDKSESADEEERMIRSIETSDSDLAVGDMLKRLASPIYAIRSQALLALEKLPLDHKVEDALIKHVSEHQFASAYRAARILGNKGAVRAAPALRKALGSEDYLLQAYAASALGELKDTESRAAIEAIVRDSDNVLVLVHAIEALKDFENRESIPVVLATLFRPNVPSYLRDEVVYGLAGILGFDDWFYLKYLAFLEKTETGMAMLMDEVDAVSPPRRGGDPALIERHKSERAGLLRLIEFVPDESDDYIAHAGAVMSRLSLRGLLAPELASEFSTALSDSSVRRYIRYRYFVAALCTYVWTSESQAET